MNYTSGHHRGVTVDEQADWRFARSASGGCRVFRTPAFFCFSLFLPSRSPTRSVLLGPVLEIRLLQPHHGESWPVRNRPILERCED